MNIDTRKPCTKCGEKLNPGYFTCSKCGFDNQPHYDLIRKHDLEETKERGKRRVHNQRVVLKILENNNIYSISDYQHLINEEFNESKGLIKTNLFFCLAILITSLLAFPFKIGFIIAIFCGVAFLIIDASLKNKYFKNKDQTIENFLEAKGKTEVDNLVGDRDYISEKDAERLYFSEQMKSRFERPVELKQDDPNRGLKYDPDRYSFRRSH